MSPQRQSKTPQPTPGHVHDYSQVVDNELVILTNNSTNTEQEKSAEKAHQQEEAKWRERERKAEHKAKHEEAKRWKAEEEWLEVEQKKRVEEEAQRRRERAQARQNEAAQRLTGTVYDINTAQKVPGASVVVTTTKRAPCTRCILDVGRGGSGALVEESRDRELPRREEEEDEIGGEDEEEPATPHKGPLGVGVSSWWTEWEQEQQLQAAERYAAVHEKAATAFERMARAVEWMVEATEQTANKWGLYCEWAEWAEMRRREDAREGRMAEVKRTGGGWKRPQSEVEEDKNEEVDEGVEGDNEEEEEVRGEKEGREEQEGGGGQVMEE
ncbi:hypothetical protein M404DRAFT_17680 [Pisolithus tinctorius Marx 270]|uniref:Uncharacterized protein n=1 Tax=Pisolithus tinctorius Marx 270 TaxID=870435 RepID=A0A0C3K0C4_PISTI|nr:hypothetical protein M404DRAFT_17680 [Pisolithus tinctorius Marx 270]